VSAPKYVTRRADVSPTCFWVDLADGTRVPEHRIEPDARGFFVVTSARSGEVYRVTTEGVCPCRRFEMEQRCSHLDAVVAFAARVLEGRK